MLPTILIFEHFSLLVRIERGLCCRQFLVLVRLLLLVRMGEICAADSFDLCVFVGGGVKRERVWLPTTLIFVCASMLLSM